MKFLVDAQLPRAMARVLESHGHVAKHVMDINMHAESDAAIWDFALEHEMAVVTKDEDFVHRFSQGGTSPVIEWLRKGNTSRRALIQWFEPLLPEIVALIEEGERLVEIR